MKSPLSMGGYYYLTVPVKKHIEKYITANEGPYHRLHKQSFICLLIRPYLVYKTSSGHNYKNLLKSYPGQIKFKFPISKMKLYGLQPRISQIGFINKILCIHFATELTIYVQLYIKKTGRYKGVNNAIRSFCTKYNIVIDEDVSMESLQLVEKRARKKLKLSVPDLL